MLWPQDFHFFHSAFHMEDFPKKSVVIENSQGPFLMRNSICCCDCYDCNRHCQTPQCNICCVSGADAFCKCITNFEIKKQKSKIFTDEILDHLPFVINHISAIRQLGFIMHFVMKKVVVINIVI